MDFEIPGIHKTTKYQPVYIPLSSDFPTASTPMEKKTVNVWGDSEVESSRFLEKIDFDALGKVGGGMKKETTVTRGTSPEPRRSEDPPSLSSQTPPVQYQKRSYMKPGKFDGTGSLESFLAQFEVCARYNRWSGSDKGDFLRCALEKSATQLLWDFGAGENVSYDQLVERLRQRYGAEGQAETFRAQLYYRRQRPDENLGDLLHDIRRLVVLAYPVPSNETTEIVARDAFLEAIRDRELSLKIREREPKNIDEAYRIALRLGAYQNMAEGDDRRRAPNRVRGAQGMDAIGQLQTQMGQFSCGSAEVAAGIGGETGTPTGRTT